MSTLKYFSISDKFEMLNEIDKGVTKKILLKNIDSDHSSSTILKNRKNIIKQAHEYSLLSHRNERVCVYEKVDKTVFKLTTFIRNNNLRISDTLIDEKAIYIDQKLSFVDFHTSSG